MLGDRAAAERDGAEVLAAQAESQEDVGAASPLGSSTAADEEVETVVVVEVEPRSTTPWLSVILEASVVLLRLWKRLNTLA